MNNNERFEQQVEQGTARDAALLALDFADGCGSRSKAWSWADRAAEVCPAIKSACGSSGWPDTDSARKILTGESTN